MVQLWSLIRRRIHMLRRRRGHVPHNTSIHHRGRCANSPRSVCLFLERQIVLIGIDCWVRQLERGRVRPSPLVLLRRCREYTPIATDIFGKSRPGCSKRLSFSSRDRGGSRGSWRTATSLRRGRGKSFIRFELFICVRRSQTGLGSTTGLRGGLSIGGDTRAAVGLLKGPSDCFDLFLSGLDARGSAKTSQPPLYKNITYLVVEILCPPFRHELLL
jgi:hypothetical protein